MRRGHLIVGLSAVVAFAITGQVMRHHSPPLAEAGDAARLMYRSRHIYLLGAALVNVTLGLYFQSYKPGWRAVAQRAGSALICVAPVLLTIAFAVEPGRGFAPEMAWSSAGIYATAAGCLLHVIGMRRGLTS
jgi:hypothetical protein